MEPQGLTDYQYDKRYLVPMVERVPSRCRERWLRWLAQVLWRSSGWERAGPWPEVDESGVSGPWSATSRPIPSRSTPSFRLEGGDVLVNVTNDAWYGREPLVLPQLPRLWQHPAHMVMRAIENRMGVARAANTGISLFVDPVGRVYDARHRLFDADVRRRHGCVYQRRTCSPSTLGIRRPGGERLRRGGASHSGPRDPSGLRRRSPLPGPLRADS